MSESSARETTNPNESVESGTQVGDSAHQQPEPDPNWSPPDPVLSEATLLDPLAPNEPLEEADADAAATKQAVARRSSDPSANKKKWTKASNWRPRMVRWQRQLARVNAFEDTLQA
ncbi:MAG: preprotein translocase subunit SecA, partial [Rhodopirellula bahusiensis]